MLLVLVGLSGCASQKSKVVGTWKVQVDQPKDAKNDASSAFGNALASVVVGPLELKGDDTFTWTMMGVPAAGTWTMSGSTVTLNIQKVAGMDANANSNGKNKPMVLTLSSDGKTLSGENTDGKGTVAFVKQS